MAFHAGGAAAATASAPPFAHSLTPKQPQPHDMSARTRTSARLASKYY
jgi:hypothetical protein